MDLIDYQQKLLRALGEEISCLEQDILDGVPGTELQYRKLVARRQAFVDAQTIAKEIFGRVEEDS